MIQLFSKENAPVLSKATLSAVEQANGFIPNLFKALSNSPSALNGFAGFVSTNDEGSLSPVERQIVQLVASVENGGAYCVAGHSVFSEIIGIDETLVQAIRNDEGLADRRYQALVNLTKALMRSRGQVTRAQLSEFQAAGYAGEHFIDVIICIALKTVTNYISSAFDLPLDAQFKHQAWDGKITLDDVKG